MISRTVLCIPRMLVLVICLLAMPLTGLGPVRAAANELIASPMGSGSACTRAEPCSLWRALHIADDNGLDDVITLLPGVHDGEEYLLKEPNSLVLRGEPGVAPTDVIIDADGEDNAFLILARLQSGVVTMRGITLQGATGTGLGVKCDQATLTVTLERMIVQGNSTAHDGGGIEIEASPGSVADGNAVARVTIRDSIIRYNQANKRGGGIKAACGYGESSIHLEVINTLIHGNRANWTGGGIDLSANEIGENNLVEAIILHSTITGNVADSDNSGNATGGGIHAKAYSGVGANVNAYLYNSIVHGNSTGSGEPQDVNLSQARQRGSTVMMAHNSDMGTLFLDVDEGVPTYLSTDTISADPLFRNSAGGDYRLQFGSPCLDRGTTDVPIDYPSGDLDGLSRISGPGPDMGAYEFQSASTYLPLALRG